MEDGGRNLEPVILLACVGVCLNLNAEVYLQKETKRTKEGEREPSGFVALFAAAVRTEVSQASFYLFPSVDPVYEFRKCEGGDEGIIDGSAKSFRPSCSTILK